MSSAPSGGTGVMFRLEVKQYWALNISVHGHLFGCVKTRVRCKKRTFLSKGMAIYILFLVF